MKTIIQLFESFDFRLINQSSEECSFEKDLNKVTISPNGIIIDDTFRILRVPYSQINIIAAIAYALTPTLFHKALPVQKRNFLINLFNCKTLGPIEKKFSELALEVFIKYRLILQNSTK